MSNANTNAPMSVMDTEAYLNEYVAVKLFRDNDRYKDDVYVAVNGHNCVIKRGEWVKIKRKFALVLDQSEIQDMRTAEMMDMACIVFVRGKMPPAEVVALAKKADIVVLASSERMYVACGKLYEKGLSGGSVVHG